MPTPAISLTLKRFRRRFGISAPRVVVRTHLPWQWLFVPAVLLALLLATAGWLMAQRNETGELSEEVGRLRHALQAQGEELQLLRSAAGTGKSAVSIEKAAQQRWVARTQR